MSKLGDETDADAAMKALVEMFNRVQLGKSRFSGTRYEPKIQDGKIVFVPNANDVAFNNAFDEVIDETFGTIGTSDN